MAWTIGNALSRRERQIMMVLYEKGEATANEILEALPDPPGNSAVRGLLRILEAKGHIRHTRNGVRFVYAPRQPRDHAAHSALAQVVQTFFGGNVEQAVTTLVSEGDTRLSDEQLARLASLIEQARQEGR